MKKMGFRLKPKSTMGVSLKKKLKMGVKKKTKKRPPRKPSYIA